MNVRNAEISLGIFPLNSVEYAWRVFDTRTHKRMRAHTLKRKMKKAHQTL